MENTLINLHPELKQKTIWNFMPVWASDIVWKTIQNEQMFQNGLPNDSFYKMVSLRIVHNAKLAFRNAHNEGMRIKVVSLA